jgi:hypothetical protein
MLHGQSKPLSLYELFVEPEVHEARIRLPGHIRQRVKRAIDDLAHAPRPAGSSDVDVAGLDVPAGVELRRLRMDVCSSIRAEFVVGRSVLATLEK